MRLLLAAWWANLRHPHCRSRGPYSLSQCVREWGHGDQHRNARGWTWK